MAFNNGPKLVTQGLNLLVDAGDPTSYPGSGTTWRDVVGGQNGIISGSVSYTSSFYGGLVFSGPTASVIFPTSSANFGTGSFTVELAFRPERIQGIHYLVSKNSGSFPNWGIYLSGSGGSGKLFSFFNISSTVSCSVSSSTTFVTGSNYQVDVKMLPGSAISAILVDSQRQGGAFGNGTGSLTNTGSLFIGNYSQTNTGNFSGSIYTVKIYSNTLTEQPVVNFNAIAPRINKPVTPYTPPVFELLIVAGGGGGGQQVGGGGGAGGLQYFPNFTTTTPISQVTVGNGGGNNNSGANSTFGTYISIGGGKGGGSLGTDAGPAGNGGSGGGGGFNQTPSGSGTLGQGNNGAVYGTTGGGGGGASTAGTSTGIGGSGSFIASFAAIGGSPAGWFAGGGGGAFTGAGGIGGGSGGSSTDPAGTGSANTGGGGGGGKNSGGLGGAGGSGIVAIRYSGGPIGVGGEITQSDGFTYHVYRTVGTSSFTLF